MMNSKFTAWGAADGGAVHDPVSHQQAPSGMPIVPGGVAGEAWRPNWSVPHLVFQGGHDRIPRYSMIGGGFIPSKSFAGKEGLMYQPYVTPVSSISGGGFLPSKPNFLTRLFNGIFQPGLS